MPFGISALGKRDAASTLDKEMGRWRSSFRAEGAALGALCWALKGKQDQQAERGQGQGVPRPGASYGLQPRGWGGENMWLQDSGCVCVSGVGEESGQVHCVPGQRSDF